MNHLLKMFNSKVNYEKKEPKYKRKRNNGFIKRSVRIAYFMGGFWFCFTRKQWSDYTGVGYNTIVSRHRAKKDVVIILGYKKGIDGRAINAGRPIGSKNKKGLLDNIGEK